MSNNIVKTDKVKKTVTKTYRNALSLDNEKSILISMNNKQLTPQLLSHTTDSLTIAYIKGKNFLEILEQLDTGKLEFSFGIAFFEKLLNWLFDFQQEFFSLANKYIVLQDIHLRNFIFSDDTQSVIGIDFESWIYGLLEENFASLLVSIKSYRLEHAHVANSIYEHLLDILLQRFDIDSNVLYNCIVKKEQQLCLRRAIKPPLNSSTAVVLMGGKSSRMKHRAKSLLPLGNYTFLDYILYQLESFDNIALSVDSLEKYNFCTQPLWLDVFTDIGPLGGLYTALQKASTPLIFFTACDTPNITHHLIAHLYSQLNEEDDCVIPLIDGQLHPLFGIYRTRILPIVLEQIHQKNYKLRILLNNVSTHYVELSSDYNDQLANINTPEDYALQLSRIQNYNIIKCE